ncbi:MAG: hypothetical protein KIS86_06325 [Devosia sp.]|nr:hypothetical protein [Devosia sp.]
MPEYRTKAQIEADRLDLEIYRLAGKLERFAEDHRAPDVDAAAIQVLRSRQAIRSYMHKNDREATNG